MIKSTLIITTYNRESLFRRCLHASVTVSIRCFHQIIVVDDSLNPYAHIVASEYSSYPIRVLFTGGDRGSQFSRNLALENTFSDYVSFVDDDDYILPHAYASMFAQAPDDVSIVYGYGIRPLNISVDRSTCEELIGDTFSMTNLSKKNPVPFSSSTVKTSLLKSIDGFDESLASCQDWDIWIRLRHTPPGLVWMNKDPVVFISNSANSISRQAQPYRRLSRLILKHKYFFFSHTPLRTLYRVLKGCIA